MSEQTTTATAVKEKPFESSVEWMNGLGNFVASTGNVVSPIIDLFTPKTQQPPVINISNPPPAYNQPVTSGINFNMTWLIGGAIAFVVLIALIFRK